MHDSILMHMHVPRDYTWCSHSSNGGFLLLRWSWVCDISSHHYHRLLLQDARSLGKKQKETDEST